MSQYSNAVEQYRHDTTHLPHPDNQAMTQNHSHTAKLLTNEQSVAVKIITTDTSITMENLNAKVKSSENTKLKSSENVNVNHNENIKVNSSVNIKMNRSQTANMKQIDSDAKNNQTCLCTLQQVEAQGKNETLNNSLSQQDTYIQESNSTNSYENDKQSSIQHWVKYRQNLVSSNCKNMSKTLRVVSSLEDPQIAHHLARTHIIVDDEKKLLFCGIPKVSSTSWKRKLIAMSKIHNVNRTWILTTTAIRHDEMMKHYGLRFLHTYSPSDIADILKTYFKFVFVRHPFDRLVSAFKDKFNPNNPHKGYQKIVGIKAIKMFRKNASHNALETGNDVTMKEFLQYVVKEGLDNHIEHEHWQTYIKLCLPCLIHYDVIGKLETHERDMKYMLSKLWPQTKDQWFPHGNPARSTDARKKLFKDIPLYIQSNLRFIYQQDFQMFDY